MSLITIFLIIAGVIILLYILNNYMITECFDNVNPEEIRSKAYKQIEIIKDNYNKLKDLYKRERAEINEILDAKRKIKDAINNIDILLVNSYDRYKLSDLYDWAITKGNKYLPKDELTHRELSSLKKSHELNTQMKQVIPTNILDKENMERLISVNPENI